jgi:hypothetical protein
MGPQHSSSVGVETEGVGCQKPDTLTPRGGPRMALTGLPGLGTPLAPCWAMEQRETMQERCAMVERVRLAKVKRLWGPEVAELARKAGVLAWRSEMRLPSCHGFARSLGDSAATPAEASRPRIR